MSVKSFWVKQKQSEGATVLDDSLQKSADPISELKKAGDRVAVVVPFEYLWDANLKPFENKEHLQRYDADLLADHLEKAGYSPHILKVLQSDGFTYLTGEAVKHLNSKERRRLERVALQKKADDIVTSVVGTTE